MDIVTQEPGFRAQRGQCTIFQGGLRPVDAGREPGVPKGHAWLVQLLTLTVLALGVRFHVDLIVNFQLKKST